MGQALSQQSVKYLMFSTEKENRKQTADIKTTTTTSIPGPIENALPANTMLNAPK